MGLMIWLDSKFAILDGVDDGPWEYGQYIARKEQWA